MAVEMDVDCTNRKCFQGSSSEPFVDAVSEDPDDPSPTQPMRREKTSCEKGEVGAREVGHPERCRRD